jgi:hypothetical protein
MTQFESRWLWICQLLVVLAGVAAGEQSPTAVAVFTSPALPVAEGPLRAVAVSDRPLEGVLTLRDPRGKVLGRADAARGGPPHWLYVEVQTNAPGAYRACVSGDEVCEVVWVSEPSPQRFAEEASPLRREWNRATEDLYAVWIEKLFDDPLQAEPSWPDLHTVTRQSERNFLYNHLGLGEDQESGLRLEPDCADLPYFLRAYFAWKLGLPFGYSECSRGGSGQPPSCGRRYFLDERPEAGEPGLARIRGSFRHVADVVHSGAGRAPAASEHTDLYPVRLAADTLRPGTVYADPYGHTLLLVQRLPQTESAAGLLLAVDAQPDGTVARKRYWRGNFLFAIDPALGSAGFKRFRPLVRTDGTVRALNNAEIATAADYGDYSLEQYQAGVEGFYDRVDAVLSPRPLDPQRALRDMIQALEEQVRTRVRSVANGEQYVSERPGIIAMPHGGAIFETTGAWEDYATPSRDLRLLIAIDVVRAFPAKVEAQPQRFALPPVRTAAGVQADLEATLRHEVATRRIAYVRSDGSPWTLTLGDVLARAVAFEMAYNPNDCVEKRWGAPPGSDEAATCNRHAPAEQTARMEEYRPWFHERRRPAR